MPEDWEEKYDSESGQYYLNVNLSQSSLRHPGKPLPPGWKMVPDDEGRCNFQHKTGFTSWVLEGDDNMPGELKKELKEYNKYQ